MEIVIRHAEPDANKAIHRIFSGSRVIEGTLHLPLPPAQMWRKRLSERPESLYALVACVGGEVIGDLGLETYPTLWRRRHVG
jgi:L-phenylalanine/L-methionine N-acetyltransferase